MSQRLHFVKMQGLGNDYIYLDARGHVPADLPALARRLSDRHLGIGSDGLVLLTNSTTCDFGMRIFNADGSEAQMCGNASRCIGKYVYERGLTFKTTFSLETKAGAKTLYLHVANGTVQKVTVDMGIPRYNAATSLVIDGRQLTIHEVDMGNPHAVCFVPDERMLSRVLVLGHSIECHPHFPWRTNVEFVHVHTPNELLMRVWERGSGETLACGTGACAAVVAAVSAGLAEPDAIVRLRGGDLQIVWKDNRHVEMTGGAELVFEGDVIM